MLVTDAPRHADPRASRAPQLVPVLGFWQEAVLRLLALVWVGVSLSFWVWWASPGHLRWTPGAWAITACLAWLFVLGSNFLFFACRMTRPNPAIPVSKLRVAMVVTRAPSEPWSVLQGTLRAMLAQRFPHPYDVWLLTERHTKESTRWCRRHGVQVSCRHGVPRYHRATWPRRTRCKEGNLAYFYDQVGYDRYDVVVQLDCDHVPTPDYLSHMVRPFTDPSVGYVAAPSICDANADRGWTVRGRLHNEATLHGPIQAGSNGGWAPICVGSHYAVRTQAVRDVGGIGPDLAEDYTTTLWLQAGGWQGVFAIDAEAHGDGPPTLEAMLTQEVQWARSLGTILTRWMPHKLGALPGRARLRLGMALAYYLINGAVILTGTTVAVFGVLTGHTWHTGTLLAWYAHLWPCSVVLLMAGWWLRRCAVLRPARARLWSGSVALFVLLRWPWTFWAFLHGMLDGLRRRAGPRPPFKVTPKGAADGVRPVRVRTLAPTLALGVGMGACAVLAPHPERALGMLAVVCAESIVYLVVAFSAVALHPSASGRRSTLPALCLAALAFVAVTGAIVARVSSLHLHWA